MYTDVFMCTCMYMYVLYMHIYMYMVYNVCTCTCCTMRVFQFQILGIVSGHMRVAALGGIHGNPLRTADPRVLEHLGERTVELLAVGRTANIRLGQGPV